MAPEVLAGQQLPSEFTGQVLAALCLLATKANEQCILTCSVDRRFCGARPCIQIRFVSISCSQKAKHWVGCRRLMRACSRCGVQMMRGIAS